MGWKTAARKAATTAARAGTGGGIGTDRAGGRLSCRHCGRPVRSSLGGVCSRPRCHRRDVLAEES